MNDLPKSINGLYEANNNRAPVMETIR